MDLNNRRTGKDPTKPRTLGILGHSEVGRYNNLFYDDRARRSVMNTHSLEMLRSKSYSTYVIKQNRSTEGCSKLKRSVDMTSSGKNGLN